MVNFMLFIFHHNKIEFVLKFDHRGNQPRDKNSGTSYWGPSGWEAHAYFFCLLISKQTNISSPRHLGKKRSQPSTRPHSAPHPMGSFIPKCTVNAVQMKCIQFDEDDGKGILKTGKFQSPSSRVFRCTWLGNCLEKKIFALSFQKFFLFRSTVALVMSAYFASFWS